MSDVRPENTAEELRPTASEECSWALDPLLTGDPLPMLRDGGRFVSEHELDCIIGV